MILARPKSQILTTSPCPLIRTFAGLRSLWTMLAEWRYFNLNVEKNTHRASDTGWTSHLQFRRICYRFWTPSADRYHKTRWLDISDRNFPGFVFWEQGPKSYERCWGVYNFLAKLSHEEFFWFRVKSGRDLLSFWLQHMNCRSYEWLWQRNRKILCRWFFWPCTDRRNLRKGRCHWRGWRLVCPWLLVFLAPSKQDWRLY